METNDSNFRWPDSPPYPPQSWWELRGAELELEPAQIRFAVALLLCGGPDSRNNTIAARTAGLDLDRTQAFRLARSVKGRKLIDEAEQTKKGERKPLTEDEIDARIDRMILSPHDLAAAKGVELRDKARHSAKNATERLRMNICPTANFTANSLLQSPHVSDPLWGWAITLKITAT
jgi:hypothetical protein